MATDKTIHSTAATDNISTDTVGLFLLSKDPAKAMQQMMDTIDTLREIYSAENKALETADTESFVALQQRKIETAYQYRAGSQQIISRKDEIKKLDPSLRKKFIQKQQDFSLLANENIKALNRMKDGLNQLNERILQAARKAALRQSLHYGENGTIGEDSRGTAPSLNESA